MDKQKPSELEIALQTIEHLKNRIEVLEKGRAEDLEQILKVNEQLKKESIIALRESEEKFRVLVEESPLGVSLIGKDGKYKWLYPNFPMSEKTTESSTYWFFEFFIVHEI